ncbi:histidine phosphatase family protein [Pontibacter sp. 172403-2]|uniref:histidine phosphatase family protein n=1 Tax=Pontibacter rufus TaxID=2791028 RepID=UPI0018AF880E|nr:histidine phosphatase family protein [Pontibacter sp. 172403-2]MBF9253942.1 histidine phosphatase family protein [Pontibacter sp. 172403-2]
MKLPLLLKLWLVLLIFGFPACRNTPAANEGAAAIASPAATGNPTVVYVVRHAEKDISDPDNQDPGLTALGEARAEALREKLEGQPVAALYATKYLRTINTLKPLAMAHHLEIIPYAANNFGGLKQQILQNYSGKTVVVAAHSNTLLPVIQAFGAETDIAFITEQQYDYLFKITVAPEGTSTVETGHYGAES